MRKVLPTLVGVALLVALCFLAFGWVPNWVETHQANKKARAELQEEVYEYTGTKRSELAYLAIELCRPNLGDEVTLYYQQEIREGAASCRVTRDLQQELRNLQATQPLMGPDDYWLEEQTPYKILGEMEKQISDLSQKRDTATHMSAKSHETVNRLFRETAEDTDWLLREARSLLPNSVADNSHPPTFTPTSPSDIHP